jgi:hypothetical protein
VIDVWLSRQVYGAARAFTILPALSYTWFPGQYSYAVTFAWLGWSVTVAWGKGTRP